MNKCICRKELGYTEDKEIVIHLAWCPEDTYFYKKWVEDYENSPWWKKLFMNPDPRSAWF